jgi:hypothetical protein
MIDLLKNIQSFLPFDDGSQGKLWFEIRRLLKKDILSDALLYSDGRAVRNHLLKAIQDKDTTPMSPSLVYFSQIHLGTKKVELQQLHVPGTLPLTRQTSQ